MVDWNRFSPADFEYDFDSDKLAAHKITFEEAVSVSFLISQSGGTRRSKIGFNLLAQP